MTVRRTGLFHTRSTLRVVCLLALACLLPRAYGADINFVVQPIIDREATSKAFQPLADYIAKAAGKPVTLVAAYDFADYWLTMKQGKRYNLILDSPFYTDYRIKKMGYVPLVKVPGVVSYSLVSLPNLAIFDPQELVGQKVASLIPPSPGALVLARMFPKPTRQPVMVPVKDSTAALKLLRAGSVMAAMIPSPVAAQEMATAHDINVIATSEQFPHIALSAAPGIDEPTRAAIIKALLEAKDNPAGKEMLSKVGLPEFEPATAQIYDGYAKYLEEGWPQ